MGFEVDPDAVAAYASVLRAQADHHDEALKYLEKHIDVGVSEGDGLITTAEDYNPKIVKSVRKAIKEAQSFFDGSADAMEETAKYYSNTEYENAKKLDETYKGGETITVEKPGPQSVTHPREVEDPTEKLKTPAKPDKFDKGPIDLVTAINNAASLSTYIRLLAAELNKGKDPFDEAVKEFSGDWEAFAKASTACGHLAEFYASVYKNLNQYAQLSFYWTGNASDLAVAHFYEAGRSFFNYDFVPQPSGPCTEENPNGTWTAGPEWGYVLDLVKLSEGYLTLAQDVSEFAGAANSALNAVIDTIALSAISAIGTAVTSWTGVGAAIGASTTAALMGKVASHILDFTTAVGNVSSAIDSFSLLDATGQPAGDLESIDLPKPYQTPEGM